MFYSVGGVAHVSEFANRFILYNTMMTHGSLSKVCFEVDLFAREQIIMMVVFKYMLEPLVIYNIGYKIYSKVHYRKRSSTYFV